MPEAKTITATEFIAKLPEGLRTEGVEKMIRAGTLRLALAGRDPNTREVLYHEQVVDRYLERLMKESEGGKP